MARRSINLEPHEAKVFHLYVARTDNPNDCWEWQDERNEFGYGILLRKWPAHRVAFFLHYGKQPRDLNVLHSCNNPPCCNPHHLFLDTQQVNIQQCVREGRHARVSGARLTPEQVLEIRENPHIPLKVYAKRFGVSISTIQKARTGKWYKHVQRSTHES